MPASTKPRAGDRLRRRASDRIATISGFTTKPLGSTRSDGVRRARLTDSFGRETRVRLDQITKTYEPLAF